MPNLLITRHDPPPDPQAGTNHTLYLAGYESVSPFLPMTIASYDGGITWEAPVATNLGDANAAVEVITANRDMYSTDVYAFSSGDEDYNCSSNDKAATWTEELYDGSPGQLPPNYSDRVYHINGYFFGFDSVSTFDRFYRSTDGITWTAVGQIPVGNVYDMTHLYGHDGDLYAVCDEDLDPIYKSSDNGDTWSGATGIDYNFLVGDGRLCITENNKAIVADTGGRWWKSDFPTMDPWSQIISPNHNPYQIECDGDGMVVTSMAGGYIAWSEDDQTTWTEVLVDPSTDDLRFLEYSTGVWFTASTNGRVFRSFDGKNWEQVSTISIPPNTFDFDCRPNPPDPMIMVGGGNPVAHNRAGVVKSTDGGVTWDPGNAMTDNVAYSVNQVGAEGWVGIGAGTSVSEGVVVSEDDGASWIFKNSVANPTDTVVADYGLITTRIGNDVYCADNDLGLMKKTTDGWTWTNLGQVGGTYSGNYATKIVVWSGDWWVVKDSEFPNPLFRSTNSGTSWTGISSSILYQDFNYPFVGDAGSALVGLGQGGSYTRSTDGTTWPAAGSTPWTSYNFYDSVYRDGVVVAGCSGPALDFSYDDGVTWETNTLSLTETIQEIRYVTLDDQNDMWAITEDGHLYKCPSTNSPDVWSYVSKTPIVYTAGFSVKRAMVHAPVTKAVVVGIDLDGAGSATQPYASLITTSGIKWRTFELPCDTISDVVAYQDTIVATAPGAAGNVGIVVSTDRGLSWQLIPAGASAPYTSLVSTYETSPRTSLSRVGPYFFVVDSSSDHFMWRSRDGVTWTKLGSVFSSGNVVMFSEIGQAYDYIYVAYKEDIASSFTVIVRSIDYGATWIAADTSIIASNGQQPRLSFANYLYPITVAVPGTILRGTDTSLNDRTDYGFDVNDLAPMYGNDEHVWVNKTPEPYVRRAVDYLPVAANFFSVSTGTGNVLRVDYINNLYVALKENGSVAFSTDQALTWSDIDPDTRPVIRDGKDIAILD